MCFEEILFPEKTGPLAPSLPPGAGARAIPLYYREHLNPVIQRYRNRGAAAAGRSPRSVGEENDFYRAKIFSKSDVWYSK